MYCLVLRLLLKKIIANNYQSMRYRLHEEIATIAAFELYAGCADRTHVRSGIINCKVFTSAYFNLTVLVVVSRYMQFNHKSCETMQRARYLGSMLNNWPRVQQECTNPLLPIQSMCHCEPSDSPTSQPCSRYITINCFLFIYLILYEYIYLILYE